MRRLPNAPWASPSRRLARPRLLATVIALLLTALLATAAGAGAKVVDMTPPAPPTDVTATSPTRDEPVLTWTAVASAKDYAVYRDGVYLDKTSGTSFKDSPRPSDGAYAYEVRSVSDAGVESGAAAAVPLGDGLFMTPAPTWAPWITVYAGSKLGAWSIVSGSVDRIETYWREPPGGGLSVDMDGDSPGAIEQSFATSAGARYRIAFAFTANGDSAAVRSLRVSAAGQSQDFSITPPPGYSRSSMGWSYRTFEVTATSSTTTLRFTSLSARGATGPVVGDVSIAQLGASTVVAVDATAPSAPVLSGPAATRTGPALSWTRIGDAATYLVLRNGATVAKLSAGTTTWADAGLKDDAYSYTVLAVDAAGNASAPSNAVKVVLDTVPPPAVAAVRAPTPTQAPTLAWDAAAGASSYRVLRDGVVLATVSTTAYVDASLPAEGSHAYTVLAVDAAGNAAPESPKAAVVVDRTRPARPTLTATSPINRPFLWWAPVADAASYAVLRDGVVVQATQTPSWFAEPASLGEGRYTYTVYAYDAAGNRSAGATAGIDVDLTPPTPPVVTAASPTRVAPVLTWLGAPETAIWVIQRDGVDVDKTDEGSWTDAPQPDDGTYRYTVVAYDGAGNRSAPSNAVDVTVRTRLSGPPTDLAADSPTGVAPVLTWTAPDGPVDVFIVYRDGEAVAKTEKPTWTEDDPTDGEHVYQVTAVGPTGETAATDKLPVVVDLSPPEGPYEVKAASPTAEAPELAWGGPKDGGTGVVGVRIERDGEVVAKLVDGDRWVDEEKLEDGAHVYVLRAVDAVGHVAREGAKLEVEVDRSAPARPVPPVAAASPTSTAVALSWKPDPDAAWFRVLVDGAEAGSAYGGTWTDPTTRAEGAHRYALVAVDLAGNASEASEETAVVVDRTPPVAPGAARATTPTRTAPSLAWDAVAGAARYRVLRGGVQVAEVAGTSFTEPAALADGTYAYALVAVDAAGNASATGAVATVVVDTVAPVRPGRIIASPALTAQAPSLSWAPVADAVRYQVYRSGALLATVGGTTLVDAPTPPDGVYSYRLAAIDAAGNVSALSLFSTSVTVDTSGPLDGLVRVPVRVENSHGALVAGADVRLLVDGGEVAPVAVDGSGVPAWDLAIGTARVRVRALGGLLERDVAVTRGMGAAVIATVPLDVSLVGSAGGVADAEVRTLGWSGEWIGPARTGADGHVAVERLPGAYWIQVRQAGGLEERYVDASAGATAVPFRLVPLVVSLADAAGAPVAGAEVRTLGWSGEWRGPVRTGDDGTATVETLPGGYWLQVRHAGGLEERYVSVSGTRAEAAFRLVPLVVSLADASGGSVAGAEVRTLGWSGEWRGPVRTGADGTVTVEVLAGGFWVQVRHAGGLEERHVQVVGGRAEAAFRLVPLVVSLADASGGPVAGAEVRTLGWSGEWLGPARTGVDGTATVERLPGGFWVQVRNAGGLEERYVSVSGTRADAAFRLVRLTARVTDPDGAGVADAELRTLGWSGEWLGPAATHASGEATVERLPGGFWLQVRQGGGLQERYVSLGSTATTVAFPLQRLTVRLLDAAGAGVAGAEVRRLGWSGEWRGPALTGAGGDVALDLLPGGYWLQVRHAGGLEERHVTLGDAPQTASYRLVPVAVSVLDAAGGGIAGARTWSYGWSGSWVSGPPTDAEGRAVIERLPGTYSLRAATGARDQVADAVALPPTTIVAFRPDGSERRTSPAVPANLRGTSPTGVAPALAWDVVPGAVSYVIERDGVAIATSTTAAYTDAPLPPDGTHRYAVRSVDAAGATSAASPTLEIVLDSVLPAGPTGLAAASPTRARPALTWTAPTTGAIRYRVYRDGVPVGYASGTAFTDVALPDGSYTYAVTGLRLAGEGAASPPVVVLVDAAAPAAPVPVGVEHTTAHAPRLSWERPSDGEGSGVVSYRVLRDGDVAATTDATAFTDDAAGEGVHAYAVVAIDAAGNASAPSDPLELVVDRVPPAAPTGLAATSPTHVAPALTWRPVADALRYRLLRDGDVVAETRAAAASDPTLPADGPHAYAVVAVDAAGNASAPSDALGVVVDTVAPAQVPALAAASPTRQAPALAWLPAAGATSYRVYRDGTAVATVTGTRFADDELAADGTYTYTVAALDDAGNAGLPSEAAVVLLDRTPPAAPAAPAATSPTGAPPALTWPAVDGARTYRVLRDGLLIAEVPTGAYTDELAVDEGVYRYRVVAIDVAGNVSEPGAEAAVVLDTSPPAAPALRAEAAITAGAPRLAWDAVDGAAGYVLRRDGEPLATVTTTTYADDDAPEGEHVYRVVATDAAGNASDPSDRVRVTVDRTPPAAPEVTAASPTNAAPRLIWQPVDGAVAYRVGRDGVPLATVDVPVVVDDAAGDGERGYTVVAVDAAGNASAPAGPVVVVIDTVPPDAPTGLEAPADAEGSPELVWQPVADAAAYVVERDGIAIGEAPGTSYADAAIAHPGRYVYTVRARDAAGNRSAASTPARVRFRPGRPGAPGAPDASSPTREAPALSWEPVANALRYRVERDGVDVATVDGTVWTDDAAPLAEGPHRYRLVAISADGAEGDEGPELEVVVDRTAPAAPDGLAAAATPTAARPTLTWSPVPDAASYVVERDGEAVATVAEPTLADAADLPETAHVYLVRAVDAAGNASDAARPVEVVVDRTAPAAPTLSALADAEVPLGSGEGAVLLALGAPDDAVRATLARDGAPLADDAPAALATLRDAGLDDSARYTYVARVSDLAGNVSAPAEVVVETPDRTAPAPAAGLRGSGSPLVLAWNPDPGVSWTLERDGAVLATLSDPTWTDPDAVDGVAPDAPGNLRLEGSDETSATIAWDAPADHGTPYGYTLVGADAAGNRGTAGDPVSLDAVAGVARYRVLVDGAPAVETERTGVTVTGLARGIAHVVQVVAIDGAGNASDPSAELEAGEDLIPARPTGLAAATPTNVAPVITWPAVPDAESYLVRRDGVDVGSADEPRFVDRELADEGAHAYAVAAVGPAGKPGEWSEPLEVVLDATAPDTELVARTPDPTRTTASVEFSSPDADATFRCAVDGADPAACTSPWNLTGLTTGEHALEIAAVDPAGNVDAEPLALVLVTDADAPGAPTLAVETLRDAPAGTIRVRLTATPPAGATRLVITEGDRVVHDGGAVSGLEDTAPEAAEVTYSAVAYDDAGNASPPANAIAEGGDHVAPAPPVLAQVDGAYPLELTVAVEDGATAALVRDGSAVAGSGRTVTDADAVDAAAPGTPAAPHPTAVDASSIAVAWPPAADEGTAYAYTATATDAAGNTSEASLPLAAVATSGIAGYRVLLDGDAVLETDEPAAALDGLAPGSEHAISVVALDAAGNESAASAAVRVVTDAPAAGGPTVQGLIRPVWTRPSTPVRLTATVRPGTAPIVRIAWTFTDGVVMVGRSVRRSFAKRGDHLVRLDVSDSAGRTTRSTQLVIVDGKAPTVRVPGLARPGVLRLRAADDRSGVVSVTASVDGGPARTLDRRRPAVRLGEGAHVVRVVALDAVGNARRVARRVVVDGSGPRIVVTAPASPRGAAVDATIQVRDAAGVGGLVVDGRAVAARADSRVRLAVGARHRVVAYDRAGNRRALAFTVERGTLLEPITDPALDGARGDQLWYDGRLQTGVRLWLLRAVADRMVALGLLPTGTRPPVRYTPAVLDAVRGFQVRQGCSGPGKADWGTIGPCTKIALDRLAARGRRSWRAG